MLEDFPAGKTQLNNWSFTFNKKNEGILTASKVQYVIEGYDYKRLGYEWNGKIRVLNQILSTDWLQKQIRVIGGAYGGFSSFSASGMVSFTSYRDPNLKETLDNYNATTQYLGKFEADQKNDDPVHHRNDLFDGQAADCFPERRPGLYHVLQPPDRAGYTA